MEILKLVILWQEAPEVLRYWGGKYGYFLKRKIEHA